MTSIKLCSLIFISWIIYRKEEAINRPKLEFVPKTLAELQIEGIHELNHGKRYGSAQSLTRSNLNPPAPLASSLVDLSSLDKAWNSPHFAKPTSIGFKPHPAPRNNGRDPWTGDFFLIC